MRAPAGWLRACLLLLVCTLAGGHAARAEPVRTGGTGTSLGTMRILAAAYARHAPDFALEIVPNLGNTGGLKALERGAVHFAVASRPLTPQESARGLIPLEFGRTPFVIATGRKDVMGLSMVQIADLYAGRQAAWRDGTPVRLVLRPGNDVNTVQLGAFSPMVKTALATAMSRPGMVVGVTDYESASHIARLPGAIGTTSLALILAEKLPIRPLAIDGAMPSVKNLARGSYPYFKTLYIVTRGEPAEPVAGFIAFVRSPEGRNILTEHGHWVADASGAAAAAPH